MLQEKKKVGLEDFDYLGTLGRGAYGEVVLVKKKNNSQEYAMKVIDKCFLFKPENLMVTASNHLKVIDFGTASFFNTNLMNKGLLQIINKIKAAERGVLGKDNKLKDVNSFVGTAEYLCPELIQNKVSSAPADLFALGCIIYKMFTGFTPFYDQNEYQIFQRIEKGMYSLPNYIPADAKDLIKRLLQRDPTKRLGAGPEGSPYDLTALKSHKFFEDIDFDNLMASEAPKCDLDVHLKTDCSFSESEAEFKSECKNHECEHKELDNIDDLEDYQEESCEEFDEKEEYSQEEEDDDEEEKFILTGLAEKKCGWLFYKERLLMLSADQSRLVYYDNKTGQFKGEIQLQYQIEVSLKDKTKWEIITPYRKYTFREIEGETPAALWVETILSVIKNAKKK